MSYVIIYSNELYHHGIKGQKWGVRRYQNYDGTYTSEGREINGYSEERTYTKSKGSEIGKKLLKTAATAALIYGGYKLATSEKGKEVIGQMLKKTGEKAITDIKDTTIELGHKAVEVVTEKAKEARKAISETDAAKAYVKTVDKAIDKVNAIPEKAREIRTDISNTPAAKAYVKTVDNTVKAVSDIPRKVTETRTKVSNTNAARTYVKAVDTARRRASQSTAAKKYVATVDEARKRASQNRYAIAYVNAVDSLLGKKKRRR